MKASTARPLCALMFCLSLASCGGGGGTNWRIQLKDGSEYTAISAPKYLRKTGYYRFRNANDKDALLRADEVLHIERL